MAEVGEGCVSGGGGCGFRGGRVAPCCVFSGMFSGGLVEVPVEAAPGESFRVGDDEAFLGESLRCDDQACELAVPKMPVLVSSTNEEAGAWSLESTGDLEVYGGGFKVGIFIAEILEVKGSGTFPIGIGVDAGGKIDGLAGRYAEVGGNDFVDDTSTGVLADKLQDEVARVIEGLCAGDAEGPTGFVPATVPAGDEGVDGGVVVDDVKNGDCFDGEGVGVKIWLLPMKLLKAASGLQPESMFAEIKAFHPGKLLVDKA